MARTTESAVEAIISVADADDLEPFIEVANAIVTDNCSDSDYTDATLELIERWLSAHCYTVFKGRAFRERADDVEQTKQSKVDLGFDTSHYGQTAMRIDSAGNLARLNDATKKGILTGAVSVSYMGTLEEDLPYN